MNKLLSFIFLLNVLNATCQTINNPIVEIKKIAKSELLLQNQNNRESGILSNASNNYDVKFYNCKWEIDPAVNYISGIITSYFTITIATNNIVFDLQFNMKVDSILYHNTKIIFLQNLNNTVTVNFPNTITNGILDSVSIYYKGAPNNSNGCFRLGTHSGTPILATLSEPYGASYWWPCKDALGDKADSIDITIICPSNYRSSSNGILLNENVVGAKRIMQYKHRFPISTYLVAIGCTNYVTTAYNWNIVGTNLKYESWLYPESVSSFASEVYGVELALNWFSKNYGTYPFYKERYAQTQFNAGGGMEHQTNSFVGYAGQELAAHELAHQWFGDKTTVGKWGHIWVNEGFATFSHWSFYEVLDPPVYKIATQNYHDDIVSDSSGSVYVADTNNINRLFNYRYTYLKGAYTLHMLRGILGDTIFFNCMKAYSNDAATKFGYATTEDVQRVFEQVSGKNLQSFYKQWIYGEGWPMYHLNWYVNTNGYINIKVNQRQSNSSVNFFEMPIQVQFKNQTKDTIVTLNVQQNGQLFGIKLNFVPDTLLIDPNLWILSNNNSQIKLNLETTNADNIKVFPVPANNSNWNIYLQNPTSNNYSIQLYNTAGQLMYKNEITTLGNDILESIPTQHFAKGIFNLIIFANEKIVYHKKLIK